jgi:hypothetical protein
MGMKLMMSTSFHPQTDGITEWVNHSIAQIFHASISPDQQDWVYRCPLTEFAINSSNVQNGELVYLSTKNLSMPKGWASKLVPRLKSGRNGSGGIPRTWYPSQGLFMTPLAYH